MSYSNGQIIVLNGASSAGKTTIARQLLPLIGADCIYTGLDDILARVQPFGAEDSSALQRSFRIMLFNLTDGRLRLFKRLHRAVVAHAIAGRNVIVETAYMDTRALQDAAVCFAPLDGLFVGVKPPLSVSEHWEAQRGDRPRGHARKHYDLIHAHGIYDLILDPSQVTPEVCAATILQRLEQPRDAFRQLLAHSP